MFFQSLPWLGIEIYVLNIAISFYRNIVCDVGLKVVRSKIENLWLC